MDGLRICLFGSLRLYRGEQCLDPLLTRKTRELFAFLVLHRQRAHTRDTLAGLFCGDSLEEQARKTLRTTLWRLRCSLEPAGEGPGRFLLVEHDSISFNTASSYWLDIEAFEAALAAGRGPGDEGLSQLTRAVELYQGDLLEGCYEDWCLYERERLQGMLLDALAELMARHRSVGSYEAAIRCGQRILHCDPLLEEVHRELMRLHCLAGNRGAALRQYHGCHEVLATQLGIGPMEETTALYRAIAGDGEPPAPQSLAPGGAPVRSGAPEPRPSAPREAPLAAQVERALGELRLVQSGLQHLNSRFQRSMAALEALGAQLGPAGEGRGRP